ncbi:MAG: CHASE2 domain-containing protein [Thermoleophilia bacterium]
MRLDRRRLRVVLIAAVGALAIAAGLILHGAGALRGPEDLTLDARFSIRGDREASPRVSVVGIDDETIRRVGAGWPLPRDLHARVIRRLAADGARVIAYDIQFSEPTAPFDGSAAAARAAEDRDLALQDAIVAARRVVLGTSTVLPDGGPDVLFDDGLLAEARAGAGITNYQVGLRGTFRRLPYEVEGLRTFAVVAAEKALGRPVGTGGFGDGGALIDYAGPAGTIPEIPMWRVLEGSEPKDLIRGRVVVVGATAPSIQDIHPVPIGDAPMSGPEINANAVATVLDGVPLREASGGLSALVIVLLAAAMVAVALHRAGLRLLIPAALVAAALYLVAAQLAFASGTVVPVVAPLVALVIAAVGALAVNYATVERDRRRLRSEFARFVPAAVLGDVLETAGDAQRLGGRRIYCTVVFCDLRGFTARAERLPPEVVIDALNQYLGRMTDAILDHGGTLVTFLGDGVMSVFGAPVEMADHADRAMDAVREMRGPALAEVNAWVAQRGLGEPFEMSVGVCSGPVMSGNVGSERRLEYAAVGDTTNTAARLQSLTRDTPHSVLVADTTRASLTRPAPDLVPVGALDLRGRRVPAAVWTIGAPGPAERSSPGGGAPRGR